MKHLTNGLYIDKKINLFYKLGDTNMHTIKLDINVRKPGVLSLFI